MAARRVAGMVGTASRRRMILGLAAAVALLVPAAIAWACGPNRTMVLDRFSYEPGQTVTATGREWYANTRLKFELVKPQEDDGQEVASDTVNGDGEFRVTFPAPRDRGAYAVIAKGFDENNKPIEGLTRRSSFEVAPPEQPRSTTPGSGGGAPETGAPRQEATSPTQGGAQGGQQRPGARSPGGGGGDGLRSGIRGGGADLNRSVGTTPDRSGRNVFTGSIARRDRVAAVEGRSGPARPSERTALGDLWSGFGSSKTPSLLPRAHDPAPPESAAGSGLAWGLALLGLGLVTLVGAFGVAEARRRRALVR